MTTTIAHRPSKIEANRRNALIHIDRLIQEAERTLEEIKYLRGQFTAAQQKEFLSDYRNTDPQELADVVADIIDVATASSIAFRGGKLTRVHADLLIEKSKKG